MSGLDLFITKKQNINFVDTLKLKEQFFPVNKDVWMPSSVRFDFTAALLSFKVGGYYMAMYKDYDINPKTNKKDFAEVMRITRGSNKKDSTYWANERPVPLTDEEKTDYEKKAVLARRRESKPYLDSLDKVNNKFSLLNLTYDSYHHRNRYAHEYYNLDAILPSIRYNTVQGFNLNYGASFSKQIDSSTNRYLNIGAKAGYGFSDKKFTGAVYASLPAGEYNLGFNAGSEILNLNNHTPISPLINTVYSLFERQNFEKLYQKRYASFSAGRRITGGWLASAYIEWADRTALTNSSAYSFFKPGNHDFTSNNPFLPNQDVPLFTQNQSFKVSVRTSYDFSDRYETYPTGRRYLPSKYPTIGLTYTKGIKTSLAQM